MHLERMFDESYERVIGHGIGISESGTRFFTRFYEIFFAKSELVREKFRLTDMSQQLKVLQKGMYQLMSFYLMRTDNDYLQSIALTHNRDHYDIHPELYELWLESLLQTVAELDPDYHEEIRLAWQIVMTPGILYLKYYHDHTPAAP